MGPFGQLLHTPRWLEHLDNTGRLLLSAGSHDLYEKPDLAYGFIVTTSSMRTAVASEYSELTIYGFVNISAP